MHSTLPSPSRNGSWHDSPSDAPGFFVDGGSEYDIDAALTLSMDDFHVKTGISVAVFFMTSPHYLIVHFYSL